MIDYAVIFAVGNPSHQSQLAYNRPRSMLPVLGKPLVLRTLEPLYRAGIRRFIVVVGEDEGSVAAYLNGRLPNVQIEFVLHSSNSSLLRTLANVAYRLGKPFLVTSYNAFVHTNFTERLIKHYQDFGQELVVAGAPVTLSKSNLCYRGLIENQQIKRIFQSTRTDESEALLLGNIAVCGQGFCNYLSGLRLKTNVFANQFLDIVGMYLQTGEKVYVAETAWLLPVETDYDLLTLNHYFLDDQQDCHILSELPTSVQILPPVRVDPQVSVGQGAQLGPHVYLEAGCSVGVGANISNAVILQNAVVPAKKQITDVIVSNRVQVTNPDR